MLAHTIGSSGSWARAACATSTETTSAGSRTTPDEVSQAVRLEHRFVAVAFDDTAEQVANLGVRLADQMRPTPPS